MLVMIYPLFVLNLVYIITPTLECFCTPYLFVPLRIVGNIRLVSLAKFDLAGL